MGNGLCSKSPADHMLLGTLLEAKSNCVFGGGVLVAITHSADLLVLESKKYIYSYKLETNRNASETNLSVERLTVGHLISRCDCNSILTECVSPNMQIHSNLHLYIKLQIYKYIQHPFRMHADNNNSNNEFYSNLQIDTSQ